MDESKKRKLGSRGWTVGNTEDFLELTPAETAYIEMKLALAQALKDQRVRKNLTRKDFARMIKSSQSRVAKMENGDPTVSLDLMVRSLLALGVPRKTLSGFIA